MKGYIYISSTKIMGSPAVTFKARTSSGADGGTWNVSPHHARHQLRIIEDRLQRAGCDEIEINDTRLED